MVFYDAHLTYGTPVNVDTASPLPCHTIGELDDALDRAGVSGGLVYSLAADMSGVVTGNRLLAEDLKTCRSDLYGVYTLVPRFTNEIPSASDLPDVMKKARMAAVRIAPRVHKFLPKAGVLSDYLEMAMECGIPFVFDTSCGISAEEVYDIMERFPRLPAILTMEDIWPTDRMYRPFLAQFPNLMLDLSHMIFAGDMEELVGQFGAERLLFASRFPAMYIGGQQLQLRFSQISDADKALIAGGNLRRMIGEAMK